MRNRTHFIGYTSLFVSKKWLIMLLFFANFSAQAQAYTLADSTQVLALIDKAINFLRASSSKDSVLSYTEKALFISKSISFQKGVCKSMNLMGFTYAHYGDAAKGKKYLQEAIHVADKHHLLAEKASTNNNLAIIYNNEGNYQKGLETCKNNLEIYRQLKDSNGIAMSYTNSAKALSFMNFFEEARQYLLKSKAIYIALGNMAKVASRCSDIGESYLAQKNTQEAKKYLMESLTICKQIDKTEAGYPCLFNLALCYEMEKNNDSALYYYQKCVKIGEEMEEESDLQYAWTGLGGIYLNMGKLAEGEKYLLKGLSLAEKFHNLEVVRDASISLSSFYQQKGNYQKAFDYAQKGNAAKDSLLNEDKIKEIAQLSAKMEMREMEMKNQYLQEENELQKLRLFRKNLIIYAVLGTMLSLLILGILLFRNNRMKTRQQHLELEQKQLRAQMNPHFIFNCLNSIQHYMVYNDIQNANKYLTEFASLMRKTLDIVGNNSITLMQEKDYLENYLLLEQMRFDHHFSYEISIDKNIDEHQVEIPPMIIQPFVENAIRHGFQYLENERQGKLVISFKEQGNNIICSIDDNGIGRKKAAALKSNHIQKHQSFGISLTKQRIELMNKLKHIGYDLSIIDKESADGQALGTQVIFKIPKEQ